MTAHRLLLPVVFVVVTAALTAQERMATGGPPPEIRARISAFMTAFNSGSTEQWLAMAREHFTPEMWARRTPAEHARLYEQMRSEFGTISSDRVTRRGPGAPLMLAVKGSTGVSGAISLDLEDAPPFRIKGIGVDIGGADDRSDFPPVPINAAMSAAELGKALDGYLSRLAARDAFSGVVVVAKDGKPVFEKAYGLADRANRVPNTTAHRFSLGSINKSFTQAAVAQLVSKGKLAYSDSLGTHLPDYPQELSRAATIEQLLTHAAGISDIFGEAFAAAPKDRFRSNADYFRFVSQQPPLFAPGARTQYCNGCYIVLGAIIERVSGLPYEQYLAERVFKAAGMTHAGFPHADSIEPNIAIGYTCRTSDGQLRSNVFMRGAAGSAAGSAFATAADLLAYDNALRERRLLDEQGTARVLRTDAKGTARVMGGYGIAGGAPGTSAVLNSDGVWTVVALANLDPPAGEGVGTAIVRALSAK